jgi:hypothetical protein
MNTDNRGESQVSKSARPGAPGVGGIVSHPSAKDGLGWGTPRFGLGEKEPGAEILRWESPALPETPRPQDDSLFSFFILGGSRIYVAKIKIDEVTGLPVRREIWLRFLFLPDDRQL